MLTVRLSSADKIELVDCYHIDRFVVTHTDLARWISLWDGSNIALVLLSGQQLGQCRRRCANIKLTMCQRFKTCLL